MFNDRQLAVITEENKYTYKEPKFFSNYQARIEEVKRLQNETKNDLARLEEEFGVNDITFPYPNDSVREELP